MRHTVESMLHLSPTVADGEFGQEPVAKKVFAEGQLDDVGRLVSAAEWLALGHDVVPLEVVVRLASGATSLDDLVVPGTVFVVDEVSRFIPLFRIPFLKDWKFINTRWALLPKVGLRDSSRLRRRAVA
jgi:hypothetical protein